MPLAKENSRLAWLLLTVPLLGACAHGRYDLAGDTTLVGEVSYNPTHRNPGSVQVVLKQDLRPPAEKSHHNLGDQLVTDSAWDDVFSISLPAVFAREVSRCGLFANAAPALPNEPDQAAYKMELVVHHFRGAWPGGAWNAFTPWTELRVTALVDVEVFFWGRVPEGGMGNLLYHHRYRQESSRIVGALDDGHRAAAEELGKATQSILQQLLVDLETEMPHFGLPPGG